MPGRSLGAQDQSSFEIAASAACRAGAEGGEGKMNQVGARHQIIREWRSLPEGAATNGRTGRAIRDADKRQIQILQRER